MDHQRGKTRQCFWKQPPSPSHMKSTYIPEATELFKLTVTFQIPWQTYQKPEKTWSPLVIPGFACFASFAQPNMTLCSWTFWFLPHKTLVVLTVKTQENPPALQLLGCFYLSVLNMSIILNSELNLRPGLLEAEVTWDIVFSLFSEINEISNLEVTMYFPSENITLICP